MTNLEVAILLDNAFQSIDSNIDALIAACTTRQQGQALLGSWQQANLNAMNARNAVFTSNDAQLTNLFQQAKDAQATVDQSLTDVAALAANLATFNTFILNVSHAVALGMQLVGLASGL